jgi:hypothetical protein
MPHWLLKWAVQRAISVLPHRQKFNEFFQEHFTHTLELGPPMFERGLDHCRTHLENFLSLQGRSMKEFTALELGVGWHPIIAVGLYLCGAGEIWLIDIHPLLKSERLARMMEWFCEYDAQGKLKEFLPRLIRERIDRLKATSGKLRSERAEEWLERWNIHAMVGDARDTGLPAGSIDLMYSTGALEYIPLSILKGILKEFRRLQTSRAVMSHWIGLLYQMSFFDKSLSPFEYLKYTDSQWKLWSSPMIRQNRLMIPDFRELFSEAGYDLLNETNVRGREADLDRVRLAPKFQKYKREDLLILRSWMVARPRFALQDRAQPAAEELRTNPRLPLPASV